MMEEDHKLLNKQNVDPNLVILFECREKRKREYPPLDEFVDAYYWHLKGDDTKMNEYILKCDEVKDKYPKPQ